MYELPLIFISQPMGWKTREHIAEERRDLVAKVEKEYWARVINKNLQNIPSYFDKMPYNTTSILMLWESIKMIAWADYAYFAKWWEEARWCKIEHEVAKSYGVKILYEG